MKTLLKFEADWCGPCQQIKPLVTDVLAKSADIRLQTVDVDDQTNQALVKQHGIRAIPTLVLLDESNDILRTHRGALNRQQLEAFVAA
jgi:thioredoxin 1